MEKDIGVILCTKIDEHAGDWSSVSFEQLFRIARECVRYDLSQRPEVADVRLAKESLFLLLCSSPSL